MTLPILSQRRSRLTRSRAREGLVLQSRDQRIIAEVYSHRYLTRTQIQKLIGIDCITRTNARLRKLFDHHYLDRRFLPTATGSGEVLYLLGRNGIGVAASQLGLDADFVAKRRRQNAKTAARLLEHELQVNNFRVVIERQTEVLPFLSLSRWLDPRDCWCRIDNSETNASLSSALRPDGFFQIVADGKLYSFFAEVDLSTSGSTKIQQKFSTYIRYRDLRLHKQELGIEKFHLLFVTASEKRRENILGIAKRNGLGWAWVAVARDLKEAPLTADVWWRVGTEAKRSLFSVGSTGGGE